ncbi:MAG: hypothetical protein OHK0013_04470 [Sandaracinaceae bacterium]
MLGSTSRSVISLSLGLLFGAFAACDCAPPAGGCTTSSECPPGLACRDMRCVPMTDGGPVDAFGADVAFLDAPREDAPFPDAGPSCAGVRCGPGQRCDGSGGTPTCVDNACADLTCSATERCEPSPDGMGHVCVTNTCADSLECPVDRYCDGTLCRPDVCSAGEGRCEPDGTVVRCTDDGGALERTVTCGSDTGFASECRTDDAVASCTCGDDWDCPPFMVCEVGRCEGTGRLPSCRLPPTSFAEALPRMKEGFPWGGTAASPSATGRPFPDSNQVVVTPAVANLDDDNGDGRINERDIPEIIFLSFCATGSSRFTTNGTLRAVHGGGPNRGRDLFATCGSAVWREGMDPSARDADCTCTNGAADLDPTAGVTVADLDGDGVPEIVAINELNDAPVVYSNLGQLLAAAPAAAQNANPSLAVANLDGVGFAEIVVGATVYTLGRDGAGGLTFVDVFSGSLARGSNGQGPISCLANIAGDEDLEVVSGSSVYRMPRPPAGVTRRADCAPTATDAFCRGQLEVVWDGQMVNGGSATREGFCAVADVLGVDPVAAPGPANPLDGLPEVVVIANGRLQIYTGATGVMRRNLDLTAGLNGGAPNVDDFDGDGFPEIGTAFGTQYQVIDLQPPTAMCPAWPNVFVDGVAGLQGNPARTVPSVASCTRDADCGDTTQFGCNRTLGQCVCLHNGWRRRTEDDSSRVTGSTVFDFNGDGAAEIVYNDECFFRVYDGREGAVLFREPSESRTRTENPIVADVDNDGNADIVFATSNESGFCSDRTLAPVFNNGLEVWADASDAWVSARRIWNQHAYHVTNVIEDGSIPPREPDSWRPWNGRLYNTYRSQPRNFGAAPNLVVDRVQITSPDAACGALSSRLTISVRIANRGDERVGADIEVGFIGLWEGPSLEEPLYADAAMTPLTSTLGRTLEPGGTVVLTVSWDASRSSRGTVPSQIRVSVDPAMRERECVEDDNALTVPVVAGARLADLTVVLGTPEVRCPNGTVPATVRNIGATAASDVVVRWYAGDPASGGTLLHEETIAGPIAPGGEITVAPSFPIPAAEVQVFVVVDPDDRVRECNDGNNDARTPDSLTCFG